MSASFVAGGAGGGGFNVASVGLSLVRQGSCEKSKEGSGLNGKAVKWNKRYLVLVEGTYGGVGSALRVYQSRPKQADATLRPSDSGLIKYELALHVDVQIASSGDSEKKKKGGAKKSRSRNTGDASKEEVSAAADEGPEPEGQASPRLIRHAKHVFGPTSVIVRDPIVGGEFMLRFLDEDERDQWVNAMRSVISRTRAEPTSPTRPTLSGISSSRGLRMEGFVEKPGKLKSAHWVRRYGAVIGSSLFLYQQRPFTPAEVDKKWAREEYVSDNRDGEAKYQVELTNTTVIDTHENDGFTFLIKDERVDINVQFRCPSSQERREWVRALEEACGRPQPRAQPTAPPYGSVAAAAPAYGQAVSQPPSVQPVTGTQPMMQQRAQQPMQPTMQPMMQPMMQPQVGIQYVNQMVMTPFGMQMQAVPMRVPMMAQPQMMQMHPQQMQTQPQMQPQMAQMQPQQMQAQPQMQPGPHRGPQVASGGPAAPAHQGAAAPSAPAKQSSNPFEGDLLG